MRACTDIWHAPVCTIVQERRSRWDVPDTARLLRFRGAALVDSGQGSVGVCGKCMMKKLIVSGIVLSIVTLGCLSPVSALEQEERGIQVEELQNEDGIYMVEDLVWGSGMDETAESLKIRFPEEPSLSGEGIEIYHSEEPLLFEGKESFVEAEFHDGGLAALTFRISPGEGAEELYGDLSDRMKELYGDIEETRTPLGDATIGSYIWTDEQERGTVLQITGMGEQVIIAVGQNK